jgi:hypothetical protein
MMLLFDRHGRYRRRLSPYLDGGLASREGEALEAHLAACQSCGRELEELRAVRAALRSLPEAPAPRSFRLTPAGVAVPASRPAPRPLSPANRGLRLAGAALATAFIVVLFVQSAGFVGPGGGDEATVTRRAGISEQQPDLPAGAAPATDAAEPGETEFEGQADEPPAATAPSVPEDAGGVPSEVSGLEQTPSPAPLFGGVAGEAPASPAAPPDEIMQDPAAEDREPAEDQPPAEAADETPTEDAALTALEDGDGGLSALTLTWILLAVLAGVALAGAAVLTIAERRRGT